MNPQRTTLSLYYFIHIHTMYYHWYKHTNRDEKEIGRVYYWNLMRHHHKSMNIKYLETVAWILNLYAQADCRLSSLTHLQAVEDE